MSVPKLVIEDEEDWFYINQKIWVNKFYFLNMCLKLKKKEHAFNFWLNKLFFISF
jgi:hypothetical protein